MDDDAFWAGILFLTMIPGGALAGVFSFRQGWLARLGGLWIGGAAGFIIAGMAHEVVALPIGEAWAAISERLAPYNLGYYLTVGLLMSPGLLLVFLQEKINERRRL